MSASILRKGLSTCRAAFARRRFVVIVAKIVRAVVVFATSRHFISIFSNKLYGEVQLCVGIRWSIRKEGDKRSLALRIEADAEVNGSPVAKWLAPVSPLTCYVLWGSLGIDIILR